MRNFRIRDKKFRLYTKLFEQNRIILKVLYQNQFLASRFKFFFCVPFNLNLVGYSSRIRNRSIETNRSRSVIRTYKTSRIDFRLNALRGILPGVKKSSW